MLGLDHGFAKKHLLVEIAVSENGGSDCHILLVVDSSVLDCSEEKPVIIT